MTLKRFIITLLSIPLLAYWLILSPVIPNYEMSSFRYTYSEDGKWKIGLYDVSVTTPISFVQFWQEKKYLVLYNSKGDYIGQTTPFCLQYFEEFDILPPNSKHNSMWFMPEACDYNIPIDKPRWWSKIIKFRLSL
ncbi:hypothetical protein SAMN04488136_101289 [Vibrio xiamenensis]|uniref:Uncharacterized protein n=1 Tax=Vibrio xiamenensis TaxID=861298 RepID=A0A1G7WCU7_9VIBR|nr:hypothetical protein SAMN04488136_101289 [Vibrio xiamenensis]